MKTKGLLFCTTMLLLASCGQQHKAEILVEDFMDKNLKSSSEVSIIDFAKIDSTKHINDSIVMNMRAVAEQSERYKQGIDYDNGKYGKTLITLRVQYRLANDTCSDTYYLDKDLTKVVAFKTN
ncbi:MAG: hypothetical protein ACI4TW_08830 [Prevotella sp.]